MARHVVALVAALAAGTAVTLAGDRSPDPNQRPASAEAGALHHTDFEFLIPEGAAERARAGERLALMPPKLEVKVGQTLRLVNLGAEPVTVNGFYVGAYEIVTQRFSSPGVLRGTCWATETGRYEIEVTR